MADRKPTERRWIETNGQWRQFNINEDDPRWEASVPYDADADDRGRPAVTRAELDHADAAGGQTKDKARKAPARRSSTSTSDTDSK